MVLLKTMVQQPVQCRGVLVTCSKGQHHAGQGRKEECQYKLQAGSESAKEHLGNIALFPRAFYPCVRCSEIVSMKASIFLPCTLDAATG